MHVTMHLRVFLGSDQTSGDEGMASSVEDKGARVSFELLEHHMEGLATNILISVASLRASSFVKSDSWYRKFLDSMVFSLSLRLLSCYRGKAERWLVLFHKIYH